MWAVLLSLIISTRLSIPLHVSGIYYQGAVYVEELETCHLSILNGVVHEQSEPKRTMVH
jgi:hypothetical protein